MTLPPQNRVLAGVAIAAAVLVAVVRPGFNRTAERPAAPSNGSRTGTPALPQVPVVDLKLERLQSNREELEEANRDPFRFRPKAPPAAAPRAAAPRASGPEAIAPLAPTGPPPPPPIAVKFFGLTVVRGERVAAFTDTRGNIFQGKEGDIIEGRYRVLRVGADSVDLAYVDGRGRQTIRLTGQ